MSQLQNIGRAELASRTLLAVALLGAQATVAAVPGEVIVAYQRYAGMFAVMSPNGSNFSFVSCGGDPGYSRSPRHFVNEVVGTTQLPPQYFGGSVVHNTEIAVADEDCAGTTVLTSEGNMLLGGSRWSPDGSMIAANATEFDLASGTLRRRGILIADVIHVGEVPVGTSNLRIAIPSSGDPIFAWSPDSRRIVYQEAGDLFMYSLDGGISVNLTNTPGVFEDQPAYAPTERIAYIRQTSQPRGSYRYDIYTIPATGGPEVQVTSKATTGSFVNMNPSYSPDGQQIAFSSGLLQGDRALYRIRADGSGKAVKIVGSKGQDWRLSFWRP